MALPELIYDPPMDPYLHILHEDDAFVIVSKPSGLLSVPGKAPEHRDCLEHRLQESIPDALTVHRLDKDTSGIVVFGRGKAAHRNLSMQFERRHVEKTYLARVWGTPEKSSGTIDLPLRCDWPNRPLQIVDHELGKHAETHWRTLNTDHSSSLIKLKPLTGRSHQLRVHMMEMGHPILGDVFYARGKALAQADRLMLHASAIAFFNPGNGERVSFSDPAPFT